MRALTRSKNCYSCEMKLTCEKYDHSRTASEPLHCGKPAKYVLTSVKGTKFHYCGIHARRYALFCPDLLTSLPK